MKRYYITLFYGYEETENGEVFHAFDATSTDIRETDEIMDVKLARMLDCDVDDGRFNWDMMDIALPESVVRQIREDAIVDAMAELNRKRSFDGLLT